MKWITYTQNHETTRGTPAVRRALLPRLPLYTSALLLAVGFATVWQAMDWSIRDAWLIGTGVLIVYFAAVAVPLLVVVHEPDRGHREATAPIEDVSDDVKGWVIVMSSHHHGHDPILESGGLQGDDLILANGGQGVTVRTKSTTRGVVSFAPSNPVQPHTT